MGEAKDLPERNSMSDTDKKTLDHVLRRIRQPMSAQARADFAACIAIDQLEGSLRNLRVVIQAIDDAPVSSADSNQPAQVSDWQTHLSATGGPFQVVLKNVDKDGLAVIAAVKHMLQL